MRKISKGYFSTLKGQRVVLEVVDRNEEVTVSFVDHFGDYKVAMLDDDRHCDETIKVKVVDHFPDVKLEKVNHFEDFEVYIK